MKRICPVYANCNQFISLSRKHFFLEIYQKKQILRLNYLYIINAKFNFGLNFLYKICKKFYNSTLRSQSFQRYYRNNVQITCFSNFTNHSTDCIASRCRRSSSSHSGTYTTFQYFSIYRYNFFSISLGISPR